MAAIKSHIVHVANSPRPIKVTKEQAIPAAIGLSRQFVGATIVAETVKGQAATKVRTFNLFGTTVTTVEGAKQEAVLVG